MTLKVVLLSIRLSWCNAKATNDLHAIKARFKRRATAVPNSIDRIKFDFSTAVARLGFKRRATAVPNSIHKS